MGIVINFTSNKDISPLLINEASPSIHALTFISFTVDFEKLPFRSITLFLYSEMKVIEYISSTKTIILTQHRGDSLAGLQQQLLQLSLFNFFPVSLFGLLLRAYPLLSLPFFTYKNILYAHSHFAFGGWIIPVLICLVLNFFLNYTSHPLIITGAMSL